MDKWVICRICLKNPQNEMRQIFGTNGDDDNIAQHIELCGDIVVRVNDALPKQICNKCYKLLQISQKFRKLCQNSKEQLTALDENIDENKVEGKNVQIQTTSQIKQEVNTDDAINSFEIIVTDDVNMYAEHLDDIQSTDVEYLQDDTNNTEGYGFYNDREEEENDLEISNGKNELENQDAKPDIGTTQIQITPIQELTARKKPAPKKARTRAPRNSNEELSYMCSLCGNIYNEKSKLNAHMKYHSQHKPHECEICHKRFTHTPQLARHMNSHTGNRPYKCKYCNAAFTDPSTKIKHERIHTNERPFICPTCNKSFSYSNVLKVHMMTHTGEKPYSCKHCGKKFAQVHHKKAHEQTHNKHTLVYVYDDESE